MMIKARYSFLPLFFLFVFACQSGKEKNDKEVEMKPVENVDEEEPASVYDQGLRPQFHFSPASHWMNDPNGMYYQDGTFHLFFQYHPDSTVWGPMHWGHATSDDLMYWKERDIALYPDSLGYIFSGSAVVDVNNTSGLGTLENPPVVAIYTYHNPEKEEAKSGDHQYQGLAYSLDHGMTWIKFPGNPVLDNPGYTDFRDPKIIWYKDQSKWIMVLAAGDRILLYQSENLIDWHFMSEFGEGQGSHDGVWECPDLLRLRVEGTQQEQWVLLVSVGTGGERGSATQYFVGDFDGYTFTSKRYPESILWLDHGHDNYAGVTWSGIPENDGRDIFIGWMSNWDYAQKTPTDPWRGAMTIPRELSVFSSPNGRMVRSYPVREQELLRVSGVEINRTLVNGPGDFSSYLTGGEYLLDLELVISKVETTGSWDLIFSNQLGDTLVTGYDNARNQFFVDRADAGNTGFSDKFTGRRYTQRMSRNPQMPVKILLDRSSIEIFHDKGEAVFTEQFFVDQPFTRMAIVSSEEAILVEGMVYQLERIWK